MNDLDREESPETDSSPVGDSSQKWPSQRLASLPPPLPAWPEAWAAADKECLWHPFTPMQSWCADDFEPPIIVSAKGAWLEDARGQKYIDGNSSIWTNIHGHNHPKINAAIQKQMEAFAHTSFLGATHPEAIQLALELVSLFPPQTLARVFYTDNGSTSMECAMRMVLQFFAQNGEPQRRQFVAFENAYHGDTLGAASVGASEIFFRHVRRFGYTSHKISSIQDLFKLPEPETVAAIIIEPLIQGTAGMRRWPEGMLQTLREWCDVYGPMLIFDEVMTGFGRTGTLFACEQEEVLPDILALAKGLTGGYLPLGALLTTQRIFDGFLGAAAAQRTLYYGHSYCGNALGCAAARANLRIFRDEKVLDAVQARAITLEWLLMERVGPLSDVLRITTLGLIAGIEVAAGSAAGSVGAATNAKYLLSRGARICVAARKHGLFTRPIGNVIVLMPPLCITDDELHIAVEAIRLAILETRE